MTDRNGTDIVVGDTVTITAVVTGVREGAASPGGVDVAGNLDLRIAHAPAGQLTILSMLNGNNVEKA